jgi:hypothetical protein
VLNQKRKYERNLESRVDKINQIEENHYLREKMEHLRKKYEALLRCKTDIQNELISTEEEKLKLSKNLIGKDNGRIADRKH